MAQHDKEELEALLKDSLLAIDANEPEHAAEDPDATEDETASSGRRSRRKAKSAAMVDSPSLFDRIGGLTSSALKLARHTTGTSLRVGKALIKSQDQFKLMAGAGASLKDMREVAGLTINELNDALNLKDKTLLEAVEDGTATLSFELILRLAALLARNDPVPFILKYTRTYSPETWAVLDDWGIGRLPQHFERERSFINIYRRHDAARKVSDAGFDKLLSLTRSAFELGLHFIAEQEKIVAAKDAANEAEKDAAEKNEGGDKKDGKEKKR